jgi:OOP family OmpA-OmpF porin
MAFSEEEIFMAKAVRILLVIMSLSMFFAQGVALADETDVEGSKDHPLFNRMPGFYISRYEEKDFDSHSFRDAKLNEIKVEGRVYKIVYTLKSGVKEPSRAQVLKNYENAMKKIGGTVLKSDWDGVSFMKLSRDGKEIWVEISAYMPYEPWLWIVEKQAMAQDIVANADVFSTDIKVTGHAGMALV